MVRAAALRESLGIGERNPLSRLWGAEPRTGFEVAREVPNQQLGLAGRHRFSRYLLVFELGDLPGEETLLAAKTYAEFPGLHGGVYRALVIGTRFHVVAVRRMLSWIRKRPSPDCEASLLVAADSADHETEGVTVRVGVHPPRDRLAGLIWTRRRALLDVLATRGHDSVVCPLQISDQYVEVHAGRAVARLGIASLERQTLTVRRRFDGHPAVVPLDRRAP